MYENWYKIEQSIRKFDRLFNKIEKFDGRKFFDPENHDRRERRMLELKRERLTKNYTYYFGNLTEEEQMFRDYYQTELEEDPDDERMEEMLDDMKIAQEKQFNFKRFDFVETSL